MNSATIGAGEKSQDFHPAVVLPPPLVKPMRHPFKWTRQRIALGLAALVGAHLGTLIIVGLYYLLFEVYHPFTVGWHNVVSDPDVRHMIRGVGEGLLGGSIGQFFIYNAYKRKKLKPKRWYDKIEIALGIPNIKNSKRLNGWQIGFWWVYVLIYAIPGFLVAWFALKGIHHSLGTSHSAITHSYWQKVQTIWTSEKDQKLVGIFASIFMGRRPLKKVANDVQLWFVEHRISKDKRVHWWHPCVYEARYNDVQGGGVKPSAISHDGVVAAVMSIGVILSLALAAFGYYVLTYIAQ